MKPVHSQVLRDVPHKGEQSYTVTAVKRAMDILSAFADRRSWTVTELARELGMNKTTTFRLVATLTESGYLQREVGDDQVRLGPQLVALANDTMTYEQLAWKAAPPLQQLSDRTGESVHVGVVHDGSMVNVQIVEGTQVLRMHMEVGKRRPAHASALGKMILAHADDETLERFLWEKGLTPHTPNTITDPERFKQHLRAARERGWVLDDEELEVGLRCLAAPVRDQGGLVFAAVSVSAPSFRLHDERVKEVRPLVETTARIVSRLMGYTPKAER